LDAPATPFWPAAGPDVIPTTNAADISLETASDSLPKDEITTVILISGY
jgi:hypothetical protein